MIESQPFCEESHTELDGDEGFGEADRAILWKQLVRPTQPSVFPGGVQMAEIIHFQDLTGDSLRHEGHVTDPKRPSTSKAVQKDDFDRLHSRTPTKQPFERWIPLAPVSK